MYITDLDSNNVTFVDKFEIAGDEVSSYRRMVDMETADGPVVSEPEADIEGYRDEDK